MAAQNDSTQYHRMGAFSFRYLTVKRIQDSWSAFTPVEAAAYLVTSGSPSPNSRKMLVEIVSEMFPSGSARIIDLGCGNGNLFHALGGKLRMISYTGVDFSAPLIDAARLSVKDPRASFVQSDVNSLAEIEGEFDLAIYSHTLEMLGSPERSLLAAARIAKKIIIRFFNPPEYAEDEVELRDMNVGDAVVPYLRRSMGRDYYDLILRKMGCASVDVYQDEWAKDQIHVLHY